MTMDTTIESLLAEAAPAFRHALRQAYEVGYREALAGATTRTADAGAAPQELAAPAAPLSAVTEASDDDDFEPEDAPPSVVPPAPEESAVEWDALVDVSTDASSGAGQPREVVRPIFPHATVGTLRQRIIKGFDLDRFDIDVVICRRGDRTRRQLKQTVKLSKYLVEAS